MIIGLVLVSLLTITAAVLFSLMAKDEREANMVVSALVIIPMLHFYQSVPSMILLDFFWFFYLYLDIFLPFIFH